MRTRNPADKAAFNRMNKAVKLKLPYHNEVQFQNYLKFPSPTGDNDYSFCKVAKRIGGPAISNSLLKNDRGEWVRDDSSKVKLFVSYPEKSFKRNDLESDINPNAALEGTGTMKTTSPLEVAKEIDPYESKENVWTRQNQRGFAEKNDLRQASRT